MLGAVDAAAGARMGRERRQRRRDGRPTTLVGMVLAGDIDVDELPDDMPGVHDDDAEARRRLGLRSDELALLAADPCALRLVAFARRTHQALPTPPASDDAGPGSVWNLDRELDLLSRFDDPFDVAALADWIVASDLHPASGGGS